MVAACWYVGGPDADDRSELRHSLRSVAANAPQITEAWCIGDVPAWFAGTRVPLPPRSAKFPNARQSLTTFVNLPCAPESFWLFMDDVIVTEPCDDLPIIHLGPALKNSTYADRATHRADYAQAMRQTTDWLISHGHPDPLAYTGHTPVLLDTATVRDFLADYPEHLLLEPYMLYVVAGAAGPGRRGGNAKCKADDNLDHKLALDIPYLSSNPDTWAGELGDWVRERWPTPCHWER